eukprot:384188_1
MPSASLNSQCKYFLYKLWPFILLLFLIQSYIICQLLLQNGYISSNNTSDVNFDENINLSLYKPAESMLPKIEQYWYYKNVDQQIAHQNANIMQIELPSKKQKKVKAALVLLIRNTAIFASIKRLQKMTMKTCKFLMKYPVYILTNHLDELNSTQMNEINTFIDNADHSNIQIIDITKYWHISTHYALSDDYMPDPESYEMLHGINYRIMCYFHTSVIFDIPQIAELDYFMRLDDDSELICSNGNVLFNNQYSKEMRDNINIDNSDFIEVDIFEYMYKNEYIYSYWKTEIDPHDWTRNFIPFILSYKKRYNLQFNLDVPEYMKRWDKNGSLPVSLNKQTTPMFFNNWEINYVPYFRSKSVRDFNKAVILSNGHFLYRWGDAPIRFFQIALFVNDTKLLCLQSTMWRKYFSYYHKKDFHYRSNCVIAFDTKSLTRKTVNDVLGGGEQNVNKPNKALFSFNKRSKKL